MEKRILEILAEIEAENANNEQALAIPHEEGEYLNMMVTLLRPKKILEVGTSTGYSTLWMAEAADHYGGRIVTLEQDAAKVEIANHNIAKMSMQHVITVAECNANDYLQQLESDIDLVFLDAEKEDYLTQFKAVFPYLKPGGVVFADNAMDLADNMRDFLDYVKHLDGVRSMTIDIGNGLEFTLKK